MTSAAPNPEQKIRVLVVEDSPTAQELLKGLLSSDPLLSVAGIVSDGAGALRWLMEGRQADVITMDIELPGANGFETTKSIMQTRPVPIVVVSGRPDITSTQTVFEALNAGALAAVARPPGPGHPEHARAVRELIATVKVMSEVKVVKRWPQREPSCPVPPVAQSACDVPVAEEEVNPSRFQLVAIGASTGGPQAVQALLNRLRSDFPLPILLVQHMTPGFTGAFADWLSASTPLRARIACHGEIPAPGMVLVAPDGIQMGLDAMGRIALKKDPPEHGMSPAVSYLFRSSAERLGSAVIGILLSGMGEDGARELGRLRKARALTIAQDKETSVVHGMPGEAIRMGAASRVLNPAGIGNLLARLACHGTR